MRIFEPGSWLIVVISVAVFKVSHLSAELVHSTWKNGIRMAHITLHVPFLKIEGFQGIPSLKLSCLGQVTLVRGLNGVGKTTLLDALRICAFRGDYATIVESLRTRSKIHLRR